MSSVDLFGPGERRDRSNRNTTVSKNDFNVTRRYYNVDFLNNNNNTNTKIHIYYLVTTIATFLTYACFITMFHFRPPLGKNSHASCDNAGNADP